MAKLAFALTLLVLIKGSKRSSRRLPVSECLLQMKKKEADPFIAADGRQASNLFFTEQQDGRKLKVCRGVHSIVSNVSVVANNANQVSSIPRVIHVTFKSIEALPPCVPDSFEKVNPNFEVQQWGDKEIIEFLKNHFSQAHVDFFNSIPFGEIKADFFRLAVLWKLGGWYLDMDIGLKQPLDKIADPGADMILSGSLIPHMVNPIIFASKPGNKVILRTLTNMVALHGSEFNYWGWSVCPNLWKTLNEEFAAKFEPSNIVAMKTSPNGLKVQMMKEESCSFGRATMSTSLVADNQHGCQPGLTDLAPHGERVSAKNKKRAELPSMSKDGLASEQEEGGVAIEEQEEGGVASEQAGSAIDEQGWVSQVMEWLSGWLSWVGLKLKFHD